MTRCRSRLLFDARTALFGPILVAQAGELASQVIEA
jgi:hypothetical protein